jgi:hypothetical protein
MSNFCQKGKSIKHEKEIKLNNLKLWLAQERDEVG